MLGRIAERVLSWLALAAVVAAGIGIWQMGPDARGAVWSGIWRTLVWLTVVAALPWTAQLFIQRLLDVGANWAGGMLLAALLLVDVLAGVLLLAGWPDGFWAWLLVLAVLGAAGAYNYLVTEYLAEQAGG